MRNYLIVTSVVILGFVARVLPDVRLSADQDDSTIASAANAVQDQQVASTIAFTSTRDNPTAVPPITGGEIYFMDYLTDGSFSIPRRLTWNNIYTDIFPALSPDGKGKIVFDSNRLRASWEPINTSDLFLMNHDGTEEVFLTRGGSPTWSPAGPNGQASKTIAFHRSQSGIGAPINPFPGAATADSDIFVVNVDDLLENGAVPRNITSNRVSTVDDDPNWSPDGQKIVFTSYDEPSPTATNAEIYVMNADGTGQEQLTNNGVEKRGPAWSPNGLQILFACRQGMIGNNGLATFEICVMEAVANGHTTQLTFNNSNDLTPTWSPDGQEIIFHRTPANQLWKMRADGSDPTPLTAPPGFNLLATSWSVIKVGRGRAVQP